MTYDIQFVQMKSSAALEQMVIEKLDTLEKKFNWLIHAEVFLKQERDPSGKGKICTMNLSLPGPKIHASSNEESFPASIKETIRDLNVQLKKRKSEFNPHA